MYLVLASSGTTEAQEGSDVDALHAQVGQLYKQGKPAEAVAAARKALALAEQSLGKDHPKTIISLKILALLNANSGQAAEAETYYKRLLETQDRVAGRDSTETIATLDLMVGFYERQGRYGDTEPLVKRILAVRERALGKDHADTLESVNSLAVLYKLLGRYNDAEPLFLRAFESRQRVLGQEHAETLNSANNLAVLYHVQGRYRDAEPLYLRLIETLERVYGKEHPDTLGSLGNLAELYRAQGRYREAEVLLTRVLEGRERGLGKDHPDTLTGINNLAEFYRFAGRYGEAEPLYKRALEARERISGKDHPDTLVILDNLASLYRLQARYEEAETLQKRALAAFERVLGREHPDTLISVGNLAELYRMQGRYDDAGQLYKRVLEARERAFGNEHPDTLETVNNLALTYHLAERYDQAEALYKRALEANERVLGQDHPSTFRSINNLAGMYLNRRRFNEAEPLFRRALQVGERSLGAEHPDMLVCANNLANVYNALGRYSEAEPLLRRSLASLEKVVGAEHPATITNVNNLALLHFRQSHWAEAAGFWRRSTGAIVHRMQRDAQSTELALTGKKKNEAERLNWHFVNLVKAVSQAMPEGNTPDAASSREMFLVAQWARDSEAAQSLAAMAARSAKGDQRLAALVRERQDLVGEWQSLDALRTDAIGQRPEKRDAENEAAHLARLTAIDTRIAVIDSELRDKFPDYAALAKPVPLAVEEVQAQLHDDEALVLFMDTPAVPPVAEETHIWVVTRTEARWVKSNLGTSALNREVRALRCGLDAAAWAGPNCAKLTSQTYSDDDASKGKPLPFDHARAHALYNALFGQVTGLINGKQLLLVPSGALTQLPFQVLITTPPANGDNKTATWLVRDHSLTVLPAVSSIKALRRVARPSAATKPMIGFGNPLLDGPDSRYARLAQLARDNQQCKGTLLQRVAAVFGLRGVAPLDMSRGIRVNDIRRQVPLPETADELCTVARDLHADPAEMYLGARATERQVKLLSESGQLAQYHIVHFATHGALAGELTGSSEPGLLLTPPAEGNADDDGYLSASEIAGLKLDADWVILSACNTAAGDAPGAQALSGLARAFIYAQARALLVSHWAVDSNATVKLITAAMREMATDGKIGRATALQRAMLTLIDKGEAKEAHPAYWAPFVVVGEGAR